MSTSTRTLTRAHERVLRELLGRPGSALVQRVGCTTITIAHRQPNLTMLVLGGFQFRRHIVSQLVASGHLYQFDTSQVPRGAVAAWGVNFVT